MTRTGPEYTEDKIRKVLLHLILRDGNYRQTARETGVPEANVRRWHKQYSHFVEELNWAVDILVRDKLNEIAQKSMDRILDLLNDDEKEFSLQQLGTIMGISLDKLEKVDKALQAQLRGSNQSSIKFDQLQRKDVDGKPIPDHPDQTSLPEAKG